jgi:hypothetical protein
MQGVQKEPPVSQQWVKPAADDHRRTEGKDKHGISVAATFPSFVFMPLGIQAIPLLAGGIVCSSTTD